MTKAMSKTQEMTLTAIAIALTYVFTAFVNIRLPFAPNGGLIHLGNVPLFITAILFGRRCGSLAGAIGMGLFDVLSGWVLWAPFTFVIVGLMGYVVGLISEKNRKISATMGALILALIIKIVGYYIAEMIIYHNALIPLTSIPGNVIQVGFAAIVVLIVIKPIEKALRV